MKLSVKEPKLTGFHCELRTMPFSTSFDFKICLRARKVSGPFEKRAPGPSSVESPEGINFQTLVEVLQQST